MDIPKFSAKVREIGDEFGKCLFQDIATRRDGLANTGIPSPVASNVALHGTLYALAGTMAIMTVGGESNEEEFEKMFDNVFRDLVLASKDIFQKYAKSDTSILLTLGEPPKDPPERSS